MNYTLKENKGFYGSEYITRQWNYDDDELLDMFNFIEKELIENRNELNEKYGGEDKWDYSDSNAFIIDDESEEPLCLNIANLDNDDFSKIRERIAKGETIRDFKDYFRY